jgi:hypothetical protein
MCLYQDTGVVWSLGQVVLNADSNRHEAPTSFTVLLSCVADLKCLTDSRRWCLQATYTCEGVGSAQEYLVNSSELSIV